MDDELNIELAFSELKERIFQFGRHRYLSSKRLIDIMKQHRAMERQQRSGCDNIENVVTQVDATLARKIDENTDKVIDSVNDLRDPISEISAK